MSAKSRLDSTSSSIGLSLTFPALKASSSTGQTDTSPSALTVSHVPAQQPMAGFCGTVLLRAPPETSSCSSGDRKNGVKLT